MHRHRPIHYPLIGILTAATVLLTAGCASESAEPSTNPIVGPDTLHPIAFDAYAYQYARQNGTRSAAQPWEVETRAGNIGNIGGIDDLAKNGFGVFAFSSTTPYAEGASVPDMMYNEKVTATTSDNSTYTWNYNPLKYWPQDYMSFFAYAPYAKVTPATGIPTGDKTTGIIALTTNAATTDPTVSYALDAKGQNVDLLYATTTDGKAITDLTYQQPVKFYFHHALTKVGGEASDGMMVVLDVDNNGNITGGTSASTTKVTVSRILLEQVGTATDKTTSTVKRSVYTGATLNLHTMKLTPTSTTTVTEGIDATSPVRHLLTASGATETGNGTLNTTIAEPAGNETAAWDQLPTGVTTKATNAYQTESAPMLLIPDGTYPVLRVTMTYYVRTQDANLESGYSNIRHTIVKECLLSQPSAMGMRYPLTLRIGVTSVKLDGSLDEWTVSHSTMIWDKTTQTWISGPNIIESNPSNNDTPYL
ncbi:MAG: fimbrillin family protein [Prevotella sp.]|nr:fimbrillin family protein [Prevotella sp.]